MPLDALADFTVFPIPTWFPSSSTSDPEPGAFRSYLTLGLPSL